MWNIGKICSIEGILLKGREAFFEEANACEPVAGA